MYEAFPIAAVTNDLKDLAGISPASIAITTTAPTAQLKGLVETFKKMYPKSTVRFITQKGRTDAIAGQFGVEAIEALPPGMFSMTKLFQSHYLKVKNLELDLLVIAYSNASAKGYYPLKLFSLMCGASRIIGVYYPRLVMEAHERLGIRGATEYENITFKRMFLNSVMVFGAIRLVDIMLMVMVLIIFTVWSFFRWSHLKVAKNFNQRAGS